MSIEYSANLETETDMTALCVALRGVLTDTGLFEVGAIRVRAWACPHYSIADNHPKNAFADLILRIGQGRTETDRQIVGAAVLRVAQAHFTPQLDSPHFALSLEVQEIQSAFSWKSNAIHSRLR